MAERPDSDDILVVQGVAHPLELLAQKRQQRLLRAFGPVLIGVEHRIVEVAHARRFDAVEPREQP